jgi:hypothetical protein
VQSAARLSRNPKLSALVRSPPKAFLKKKPLD